MWNRGKQNVLMLDFLKIIYTWNPVQKWPLWELKKFGSVVKKISISANKWWVFPEYCFSDWEGSFQSIPLAAFSNTSPSPWGRYPLNLSVSRRECKGTSKSQILSQGDACVKFLGVTPFPFLAKHPWIKAVLCSWWREDHKGCLFSQCLWLDLPGQQAGLGCHSEAPSSILPISAVLGNPVLNAADWQRGRISLKQRGLLASVDVSRKESKGSKRIKELVRRECWGSVGPTALSPLWPFASQYVCYSGS